MPKIKQYALYRIKRMLRGGYGTVRDLRPAEVLVEEELEKHLGRDTQTILYVGAFYDYADKARGLSYEHSHFYQTLLRSGYSVVYFPYDKIMKRFGRKKMSQMLRQALYFYQPDILFYYHYIDWVDHAVWKEASGELPTTTIIMLGDDYVRHEETRPLWQIFNTVVTMDRRVYEKRKNEGFTNVFLSQWGYNHFLYRDLGMERIHNVTFIGQNYGRRSAFIQGLHERGVAILPFGLGWRGSRRISQADVIKTYNQSKVTFNSYLSARNIIALNGRDFEAAGCGSFVVTQDIDEVRNYFTLDKEIVTYRDLDEAAEKIKYYLGHDAEREAIARAGHERALRDHTYEKRFMDIFTFANTIKK